VNYVIVLFGLVCSFLFSAAAYQAAGPVAGCVVMVVCWAETVTVVGLRRANARLEAERDDLQVRLGRSLDFERKLLGETGRLAAERDALAVRVRESTWVAAVPVGEVAGRPVTSDELDTLADRLGLDMKDFE
jgi:hypothetical protein